VAGSKKISPAAKKGTAKAGEKRIYNPGSGQGTPVAKKRTVKAREKRKEKLAVIVKQPPAELPESLNPDDHEQLALEKKGIKGLQ
jgi:hypothetical protein